jgi:NADPH2:quinone reductase
MSAVVVPEFGDPSVLTVRDVPQPTPAADEVVIAVEAAGVMWTDVDMRRGDFPDRIDDVEPPFVPGVEVAGTVTAVGSAVTRWEPGASVVAPVGHGGYAERVTAAADRVFPKPEGATVAEAAGLLSNGFTAHNVVHEWGGVTADETVLVHAAAGGVGSVAVQLLADIGATVVGTASTPEKRAFAADYGADYTVDYRTNSVPAAVDSLPVEQIDVVLDGVGGDAFYESLDVLAHGGRLVAYGAASGSVPVVSTPRLYAANLTLIGYDLLDALDTVRERVATAREPLYAAIADGQVEIPVTDTLPLADAAAAHRRLQSRETTGKLVIRPSDSRASPES